MLLVKIPDSCCCTAATYMLAVEITTDLPHVAATPTITVIAEA